MNKKVFTLLPIFSMFALASCGGGGSNPGPGPGPTPDPDEEHTDKVEVDKIKEEADFIFSEGFLNDKYKGKTFVEQTDGEDPYTGTISSIKNTDGLCTFDTTGSGTMPYPILNTKAVDSILAGGGSWTYFISYYGDNLSSGFITSFFIEGTNSLGHHTYKYNSHCVPIEISVTLVSPPGIQTTTYTYNLR